MELEDMNESCFFYTNKRGGYFFGANSDFSAYQGWTVFFEEPWELYKVIDKLSGSFNVKLSDKTILFEGEKEQEFFVDLDLRWIHDFSDKGRIYSVYEKNAFLIVKYEKFLDDSLSEKVLTRFLAIKGLKKYDLLKVWIKKHYPYDVEREALSDLYVFRLLKGTAEKISFGLGQTEEESIISSLVNPVVEKENNFDVKESKQTKLYDEEKEALLTVDNSFSSCVKKNKIKEPMIFAGYPWFYQVWARDECISLIGLIIQKKYDLAKNIIIRNLKRIANGILPNRFPDSVLGSADATGWLFQRIRLLISVNEQLFSHKELLLIDKKLDLFLSHCKKNSYKGMVYNGPKETWMDTADEDNQDTREGARVEIQALYLSALELKLVLKQIWGDKEQVSAYRMRIKNKKSLIRKRLIKNKVLNDGFCNGELDKKVRPNVFLAYYAYPKLVMKHQWEATFDQVLRECWLDWGGLSSISKNDPLFKNTYSGMNNVSYHRGDSWYFVNNIAGVVLNDFNPKKYNDKIVKIRSASTQELLFKGFTGYCAEISSAKVLESKGCLSQAWSAATLLEFLVKTRNIKKF